MQYKRYGTYLINILTHIKFDSTQKEMTEINKSNYE